MKYSKVFTLLQGLPSGELSRLKTKVGEHKRKTLVKLFSVLTTAAQNVEPDPECVFKAVFGKKYLKKRDYLLRNEYRLLYEWVSQKILEDEKTGEIEHSVKFLKYLLNNHQYELFEEEFKLTWKAALECDNTEWMLLLSDLNLRYHIEGKPQALATAETTAQLSKQRIELLQRNVLRQIRAEEIRLKMSERIIAAYKPLNASDDTLQNIDLRELQEGDLYAQYLYERGKINAAKGKQKIELLKSILRNEEIIRKYEPVPEEALCRFWMNLAQEYYLMGDYGNAIIYYAKAERYLKSLPLSLRETYVLNYSMALMRSDNFEKARQLAAENEQLLLSSKILVGRGPFLLAVLHLYTNDADGAEKYVKLESKKEGSEFYFFMRLVLSVIYYLRGNIDLAVRESINLDQAVNYELKREQTFQTHISKPIVSLFRRFYTTIQNALKEQLKKDLHKLKTEAQKGLTSDGGQSPNSILVQWLAKEIERLTTAANKR